MITHLSLKNWRTHENTELSFSQGVNCLIGIMGAGKSSILEAICFALFGNFPALQQRRIKIENVLMRWPSLAHEASVELDFELDGKKYEIRRSIQRGKGTTFSELRCDGEIIEAPNTQRVTEAVEKILKINYDLFSQIIFAEQNRLDYFLTIQAGKRKDYFDYILKISKFEDARASAVKLINKLKEKRKIRKEDVSRLERLMEEMDILSVKNEIAANAAALEEIVTQLKKLQAERNSLNAIIFELKKKRVVYQEFSSREVGLNAQIAQLDDRISKVDVSAYKLDEVDEKIAVLQKELESGYELEKKIARLQQKVSSAEQQLKNLEQEIYVLFTKSERLGELADAEQKLEKEEMRQKEVTTSLASIANNIADEQKAMSELKKAMATCPTCETSLTAEKRSSIMEKKHARINSLASDLSILEKKQRGLEQNIAALKTKRRELSKYAAAPDDLKNAAAKKIDMAFGMKKAQEELASLEKTFSQTKKAEITAEIKKLERIQDLLQAVDEKKRLEKELLQAQTKIKDLSFDEAELERKEKEMVGADKATSLAEARQQHIKALLKERLERLEEMEKQGDLLTGYKEEMQRLEQIDVELNKFLIILEQTQVALRQQFMDAINSLMTEIWQTLYPYADYTGIKLSAEEDYVLELQNLDGGWSNVEGHVSGGERMLAALTLRLAMAALLAPNLKWLILDEPTHNLDAKAVEELAKTLREKISPVLMEQVLLITHDEALAEAVTGKLYKLERGEGKKEVTKIIPA